MSQPQTTDHKISADHPTDNMMSLMSVMPDELLGKTPPANMYYDEIDGKDPLRRLSDVQIPKLTQEILAVLYPVVDKQPSPVEAVFGVMAQGLATEIHNEKRDLDIVQSLKDVSAAISSSIPQTSSSFSEKTGENITSLSRSAVLLAGRLREQGKKTEAAVAVEAALRLSNLLNNVGTSLELIELMISNKVFENEFMPENLFEEQQKNFKYMVFGKEGPLHSVSVPKDADSKEASTHIVIDQTRVFIEFNKNFVMYQKQPVYKAGKLWCEQMYKYNNTNHYESFYFGGNFWVTQYSDIGPIQLKSKSYHRDWSFSHQKNDRLTPKADERLRSYSSNLKKSFFSYCCSQYGTFYLISFFEENGNTEKKAISICNYEFKNEKYVHLSNETEIPVVKDGKIYPKWIDGVKEANLGFIGNNIIIHSKQCDYWIINPKTGELLEIGKSPQVINGVDSTKTQVCRWSDKDKGFYFTPCDLFSNYDCLDLLREARINTSNKEGFSGIRALGLLEHDDSYDDAQSDSGSTGLQEAAKHKAKTAPILESAMEEATQDKTTLAPPETTHQMLTIGKLDRLASFLLCLSNQVFSTQLSPKTLIPKSSIFNTLLSILSNWNTLKPAKVAPSISLSLIHILHTLITEVCKVQDSRSSGLKVISQEVVSALLQKLETIESHESAGKRCHNVFKNLKARIRIMLTGLKKKPSPEETKLAWQSVLQERFSVQEQDFYLWLGQTLHQKQDPNAIKAFFQVLGDQTVKGLEMEGKSFQGFFTMGIEKQSPNFASPKNIAVNLRPTLYYLMSHPEIMKVHKEVTFELLGKVIAGFETAAKSYTTIAMSSKNQQNWRWEHREEMEEVLSSSLYLWTFFFLKAVDKTMSEFAHEHKIAKTSVLHRIFLASMSPYREVLHSQDESLPAHTVHSGGYQLVQPPSAYILTYSSGSLFGKGVVQVLSTDASKDSLEFDDFEVDSSREHIFVHCWEDSPDTNLTININTNSGIEMAKKKGLQAILNLGVSHYGRILDRLARELQRDTGLLPFNWRLLQIDYKRLNDFFNPEDNPTKSQVQPEMQVQTPTTGELNPLPVSVEELVKTKTTEHKSTSADFELVRIVLKAAVNHCLKEENQTESEKWIETVLNTCTGRILTSEDLHLLTIVIESISKVNFSYQFVGHVLSTPISIFRSLFGNVLESYRTLKELIEATSENPTCLKYLRNILKPFEKGFGRLIKGCPSLTQSLSTLVLMKRPSNLEDLEEYPQMVGEAFSLFLLCHQNGWAEDSCKLLMANKENKDNNAGAMSQLIEAILKDEEETPGTLTVDQARSILQYLVERLKTCSKTVLEFEPPAEAQFDVKEYFNYEIGNRSEHEFLTWCKEQVRALHSKHFRKQTVEDVPLPPNTGSLSLLPDRVKERMGPDFNSSEVETKIRAIYNKIHEHLTEANEACSKKIGLGQALGATEQFLNKIPQSILNTVIQKGLPVRVLVEIACGCYPDDIVARALECLDSLLPILPPEVAKPEVDYLIKNLSKNTSLLFPTRLPFRITLTLTPISLDLYTAVPQDSVISRAATAREFWRERVLKFVPRSTSGLLVAWRLFKDASISPPIDLQKLGLVEHSESPVLDSGFTSNDIFDFILEVKHWLETNFTPQELSWCCSLSENICCDFIALDYYMDFTKYTQGLPYLHPEITKPPIEKSAREEQVRTRDSLKNKAYQLFRSAGNRDSKTKDGQQSSEDEEEPRLVPNEASSYSKNVKSEDPRINIVNSMGGSRLLPPLQVLLRLSLEAHLFPEKYTDMHPEIQTQTFSMSPSQIAGVVMGSERGASPKTSPKKQAGQLDPKTIIANSLLRFTLLDLTKTIPESCRHVLIFEEGETAKKLDLTGYPRWILITEIGDFWIDPNPAEDSYISIENLTPEEEKIKNIPGLYNHVEGLEIKIQSSSKRFKPICSDTLDQSKKAPFKTNPMILVPCLPELNQSNQFYLSTQLSPVISRSLSQMLELLQSGKIDSINPLENSLGGKNLLLARCLANEGEDFWLSRAFIENNRRICLPQDRPTVSCSAILDVLEKDGLAGVDKVVKMLTPSITNKDAISTSQPKIADLVHDFSHEYKDRWIRVSELLKEDILEKTQMKIDPTNKNRLLFDLDVLEENYVPVVFKYLRRLGSLLALCIKGLGKLPFEFSPSVWQFILGRTEANFATIKENCPVYARELEFLFQPMETQNPDELENRRASSLFKIVDILSGSFTIPLSRSTKKLYLKNIVRQQLGKFEDLFLPIKDGLHDVLTCSEIASESLETVQQLVTPCSQSQANPHKHCVVSPAFKRSLAIKMAEQRHQKHQPPKVISVPAPVPNPDHSTQKTHPPPPPPPPQEEEEAVSFGGLFD